MATLRYIQAMSKALRDLMTEDEDVMVIGEDVRASLRGVTKGLHGEFGDDRIVDMPLSEQAFTGLAMGAALHGMRPVVEFQVSSLVFLTMDQMINQAHKFHLMTGGQASVPVTYFMPGSGSRMGLAGQHSDHPYAYFVHAGIKTVMPADAEAAYGLLRAAILDPDPVAVFAPAALLGVRGEVPDEPFEIPLGKGVIKRSGADVTVVAVGHLVPEALKAAEELASEVSVEVMDPRTLYPFDWEMLNESLSRTKRLVVFDDSNRSCGLAAEIIASAMEANSLVARPRRVSRGDITIPYAIELEVALVPNRDALKSAILHTMKES